MPTATRQRGPRGRDFIPIAAWTRILEAYRLKPGQAYAAAAKAKVNYRTAQKAWNDGLRVRDEDGKLVDKPAIKSLVEAQQAAARAAREVVARTTRPASEGAPEAPSAPAVAMAIGAGSLPAAAVRDLASADATAALAEEARLVKVGRANVAGLVASLSNVARGVTTLSVRVQAGLERLGIHEPVDPGAPAPALDGDELDQAVNLMGKAAVMTRLASECVKHTLAAERMLVGHPAASGSLDASDALDDEDAEGRAQIKRLLADLAKHRRDRRWTAVLQTEAMLIKVRHLDEPGEEKVDAHVVVRRALIEKISLMEPEELEQILQEERELERLASQAPGDDVPGR